MSVKASQSALRVLRVFECLSRMQPVGLTALARAMDTDRSALQRDLATLAEAGWIRPAREDARAWELSYQLLVLTRQPHSSRIRGEQLRPLLERLHKLTGETVYVTEPHHGRFVVTQAIESPHLLRVVPPVGMIIPATGSATSRAFMALLPPEERAAYLKDAFSPEAMAELDAVAVQGYAVSEGEVVPGSTTLAAAFVDETRQPAGTLVVTGSTDRIRPEQWPVIGQHLATAAALASRILTGEGG